jgi:hypothetical protein
MLGQPQRRMGRVRGSSRRLRTTSTAAGSSESKAASASIRRPGSLVDWANRATSANAVGSWAASQAPILAAADASSCSAQRSSNLSASIAASSASVRATGGSTA